MVPMAPSATITRLANWSRNSWARVVVDVVMRNGRKSPSKRGKCDMFQFNAGGKRRALATLQGPPRTPVDLQPGALGHAASGTGGSSVGDSGITSGVMPLAHMSPCAQHHTI